MSDFFDNLDLGPHIFSFVGLFIVVFGVYSLFSLIKKYKSWRTIEALFSHRVKLSGINHRKYSYDYFFDVELEGKLVKSKLIHSGRNGFLRQNQRYLILVNLKNPEECLLKNDWKPFAGVAVFLVAGIIFTLIGYSLFKN